MIFGAVQKILEKFEEYMQTAGNAKSIDYILRVSEFIEKISKELHLFRRSRNTDIFYGVKNVESYADRCGALGRN